MNRENMQHGKEEDEAYRLGMDGYEKRALTCTCNKCIKAFETGRHDAHLLYHGQEPDEEKILGWTK